MAKKVKKSKVYKVQGKESNYNNEDEKHMELNALTAEPKTLTPEPKTLTPILENSTQAEEPPQADSDVPQTTITSTESKKRMSGGSRGVCAMHKVVMKKAQGKKFKIRYNKIGTPIGDSRHTLQSYVGMLARTMVPIDIPSWPKVDPDLKAKIWSDIQDTFKVAPESEGIILKSAGTKWRQFKSKLTSDYVKPFIGQKKKLMKPPKKYAFVGKESWRRFVAMRTTNSWGTLSKEQSGRVSERKYPHRTSRKGYIGLEEEEEVKAGRLDPEEKPDRAMFWKIARTPPDNNVDEDLAKKFKRIDELLEKKRKGEFKPSRSEDVLTVALETPEHSGRVRGVGSFVSPSTYFNLPKGKEKRTRITKAEFEKTKDDFEKTKMDFMSQIAELKAELKVVISASNLHSPMSDKASCRGEKEEQLDEMKLKCKPEFAKELMVNEDNEDDDGCFVIGPNNPSPPGKKDARKCELAVDNIDNKVAFGMVFSEEDMCNSVHGAPLQPGYARVSLDGIIKEDALVPVPIAGEIETVREAIGSLLAWPEDMIILTPTTEKNKKEVVKSRKQKIDKNEFQRVHALMKNVKPSANVPRRFMLLYKYAATILKEAGDSIQIPCDAEVFGIEKTIFLLHENVMSLLEFKMIGQAIISTYMAYLHTEVRKNKQTDLYAFIDPAATFKLNSDFESYVIQRMKSGSSRIFFMPHNENYHWILIIIWESEIFILNPLPHPTHFPELEAALVRVVRSYNAQTGRVNKNPKVKNLTGSPKQPGGYECGYVVMRYMKEIFEDKEMKFITKWAPKSRKSYRKEELDEVRFETLQHIQEFVDD